MPVQGTDVADVYLGYSFDELTTAFDEVADSDDWRNPIDKTVTVDELPAIRAAVEFFTGSGFYYVSNITGGFVHVLGLGYRNGPCGP